MLKKWCRLKKSSFIEGTFIATFAIILVKIMGMLYVIPFYAIVGTTGAALYSYAYNIYNIFLDISTVGLPIAISKITNEFHTLKMYDAKKRAYDIAISIMRFISIIIFIILFIFAYPIASFIIGDLTGGNTKEAITNVIRCVSFAILVIPYLSVAKGYLQGHNVINISSISNVLEQIVRILIIIVGSYLAIKVFNQGYEVGVMIALSGAFFGGLVSYIYVKSKMRKNKKELGLVECKKKDAITNKEIVKKIASYAIPYVIINSVSSLYSFVDMILILRGLEFMGYQTSEIEFISSSISTWAGKINMIVISIAMGMTISLIPSIVHAYTLKQWDDVNRKINSSLKIIFYVSLPMAIGLSFLSKEVWQVFYGASQIGASILSVSVFVAVSLNFYMITSSIMQSLNKYKIVYFSTIIGLLSNALFDIPLMFLFDKIGIKSYLGPLVSSIIGYLLSVFINLKAIKKSEPQINYKDAIRTMIKTLIPSFCMLFGLIILRMIIPDFATTRILAVMQIGIYALAGVVIYFFVSYKTNLLEVVFGQGLLTKIAKKLKLKFKH